MGRQGLTRRQLCAGAVWGGGALLCGIAVHAGDAKPAVRVIKIQAQKFAFTPNKIVLKKGGAVVLQLTSVDFTHGFNIPGMKTRADLLPGKVTEVRLNPDKVGEYEFLCDNFCGDGHDTMSGKITVMA